MGATRENTEITVFSHVRRIHGVEAAALFAGHAVAVTVQLAAVTGGAGVQWRRARGLGCGTVRVGGVALGWCSGFSRSGRGRFRGRRLGRGRCRCRRRRGCRRSRLLRRRCSLRGRPRRGPDFRGVVAGRQNLAGASFENARDGVLLRLGHPQAIVGLHRDLTGPRSGAFPSLPLREKRRFSISDPPLPW